MNPQFTDYSNEQRAEFLECRQHFLRTVGTRAKELRKFFGSSWLVMPLVTMPWLVWDRRMRLLGAQLFISGLGLLVVVVFFVHYAAPLTATIFVVIMQGMRHLRHWKCRGRMIGIWITRALVAACILIAFRHTAKTLAQAGQDVIAIDLQSSSAAKSVRLPMVARARIARQLETLQGKHLVIVQYTPAHDVRAEWVYNGADIDGSKIVWARAIPGFDMTPLLEYFRNRKIWMVEADALPPKLEEYRSPSADRATSSESRR